MSNERIKTAFENIIGPMLKIMQRKCKDGLISGLRILIMEKRVLESNPIPSYVHIDGNQLHVYVIYDGQNFTCKYCGNVGHRQIDCNKHAKDFPIFIQNQDSSVRSSNSSSRRYDDSSAVRRQKVVQLPCYNKIGDKKLNTSKEIFSEITEKINDEPIDLTKPFQFDDSEPINLTVSPEPESHEPMETAPLIEKYATPNNWWENKLSVLCCNCSAENIANLLPMKMFHLLELLREILYLYLMSGIFPEKHQRRWANNLLFDFDSINWPIIYKNLLLLHLRNKTSIFPNQIKPPSHSM